MISFFHAVIIYWSVIRPVLSIHGTWFLLFISVVWWFREGGMEGFIAGAPSFRHRRRSLVRRVGRPVAQPMRTLAHNLMRSVPPRRRRPCV